MKRTIDPTPAPAATTATDALETSVNAAMEQIRHDLLTSALTRLDITSLVLDSFAKVVADLTPRIDAAAAEALAQIDFSTLGPTIEAATRDIINRAAVIEAAEKTGYRTVLYRIADEHHGYVTTALAQAAGVPPVEVRKLASRGGMTNIGRGLYRVDGIDGGEQAPYAEAVLLVGEGAHLVGESVLAFHDLALVNPRHITVGISRRVRRDLPVHVRVVHSRVDPADLTIYNGVPSTTVERAIRDSMGSVMSERLADAARRAADEGLLRRSAAAILIDELGATR